MVYDMSQKLIIKLKGWEAKEELQMGFLKTDYSEVNGFEPLPIGDYEVFISEAKVVESSTGKPMIKVTLTVRDDIEQEGKKRKFFDNMVHQDNMLWKFQQVGSAVQIPEGIDLDTIHDFAAAILYKPAAIRNKHREYNGEKQDTVGFWKKSKYGGTFGGGESTGEFDGGTEISAEDLPF